MQNAPSPLDTFDHVVVLMLENRSFDNMLGYLYQNGVPPGKNFAGVVGNNLSNPDENGNPVFVSTQTNFHEPFPDPGEEFDHITAQLFSGASTSGAPQMQGFVKDYFKTLTALLPKWSGSPADQSKAIMQCFTPASLPVLSGLAQQFAVFDHWFCAVPSQTWCNRAFWHAATSWGWVNNPPLENRNERLVPPCGSSCIGFTQPISFAVRKSARKNAWIVRLAQIAGTLRDGAGVFFSGITARSAG